jgi:RNA polymerase sigma factor (sigma-70 family)
MLLESHCDLIQQRLQALGRRSGLPDCEVDEFLSWALFKLVENDYRVLADWKGLSSFPTYLTVVLVNLMRDYRIHVWGKWRSSAKARRHGPEAVLLEQLLFRDGLSFDEAIRQMQSAHGVTLSHLELEEIAAGLPGRAKRRQIGEEELGQVPIDGRVEDRVRHRELAPTATRLLDVLLPLINNLPAETRLLLKLHYRDGLSIAAISPLLGRPHKELYKSRDRCLKTLRRDLEASGFCAAEVNELIGPMELYFNFDRISNP